MAWHSLFIRTLLRRPEMAELASFAPELTIVDLPMNIVYGVCLLGFVAMLVRSVQVSVIHWRRGYTVLERPESTMADH